MKIKYSTKTNNSYKSKIKINNIKWKKNLYLLKFRMIKVIKAVFINHKNKYYIFLTNKKINIKI